MGIRILGTGSYLPKKEVTNFDLASVVDTSDAWIKERTGISKRHIATEDESVATLGAASSMEALKSAGVSPDEVDLILLATCSTDENTPSAACMVQALIGAKNAVCFDINAACTGFLTALTVADAMLLTGNFKKALVIGAETLSRIVDWKDRGTCILFGDGAGACLVEHDEKALFSYKIGADGEKKDSLICKKCDKIKMDGKEIYRFATTTVPRCIEETLEHAGVSVSEIDLFLLHQANMRIIEAVSKRLKVDLSLFPMNMEHTGNTSSASIPILLCELVKEGKVRRGQKLLMSGFGAGLTYGACVLEY